jgi:hypothetical protein
MRRRDSMSIFWIVVGLIAAGIIIHVGSAIIIRHEIRSAPEGREIPYVGFVRGDVPENHEPIDGRGAK